MNLTLDALIAKMRQHIEQLADPRPGQNTQYYFSDIAMAAFSVYFMQAPSFLSRQRQTAQGNDSDSSAASLFRMARIPSDNHIRQGLDGISPELFYSALDEALLVLQQKPRGLKSFHRIGDRCLIALNGIEFHRSATVHCELCSTRTNRNTGEVQYFHQVLTATLVAPGHNRVVPLRPQFIEPQENAQKQENELNALKRWLNENAARYQTLKPIYLGDALYACQSICLPIVEQHGADFIFLAKKTNLPTLYENLRGIKLEKLQSNVRTPRQQKETRIYRWFNDLPLRDGDDAMRVNWMALEIHRNGRKTYECHFITSIPVTRQNVKQLLDCARSRWKIDSDSFNELTINGNHLEHNFGHGEKGLANVLLVLNLTAFAFHTVCDEVCLLWQQARKQLVTRQDFFNHLAVVPNYLYVHSWELLLKKLVQGRSP